MRGFVFVFSLLLAAAPVAASAGAPDGSDYLEAPRQRHRQLRERVGERLEALRTAALSRALSLPEGDIQELAGEMRRFDERRQAIRAPIREARWTVKAAARGNAEAAARLDAALAAAAEAKKRLADLELEEYRTLARRVPADRHPQLALFLHQFPQQVQRLIHEARGKGRGGPRDGMGPRGGMGPRDGMGPRGGMGPRDGTGPRSQQGLCDGTGPCSGENP